MRNNKVKTMTIAALLSAIAIMIPMFFPGIVIGPATFTLASHVPIFIAMFISPTVAICVAVITSIGFLVKFPLIVFFRAASHLIFASLGAYMLKKNHNLLQSPKSTVLYSLLLSVIHAIAEVVVVTYFYFGPGVPKGYYENGYVLSVLVILGLGTIAHSMIDFSIAVFVWKPLQHIISIPANAKVRTK